MDRVVFLVDMNAFFISCETAKNPELKGKPAAVAGDPQRRSGIILAANYEARSYKVKTTMLVHEAKKLCPELILVPPSRRLYSEMSKKVMQILARFSPVIQQNSIDEAWLDMTGCEGLFGKPVEAAEKIMKSIVEELELWCSIGIAENKFLAKMASEMKKPMGITELWKADIPVKLWPLPVRSMYGIGAQTEKKLAGLAIYTIGDLAKSNKELLRKAFGKYGEEMWLLANGIDASPVTENPLYDNKSISRSTTLSKDIVDLDYAKSIILELAEEVGAEARKQECKGRTVSIVIKYSDFKSITRQKSVTSTYLTKEIYHAGTELLEANWNRNRPVRLLGIGLSSMDDEQLEQISMFETIDSGDNRIREEKLEKTIDKIRNKYGSDKIIRAKILEK